jgi:hypothetical protein
MSIKDDELYPKYLIWLEERKMSNGLKELSKISQSLFEQFKFRYSMNSVLKEKIDNQYKSIDREIKIDDLFDEEFNLIFENNERPKIDDDFFDF